MHSKAYAEGNSYTLESYKEHKITKCMASWHHGITDLIDFFVSDFYVHCWLL